MIRLLVQVRSRDLWLSRSSRTNACQDRLRLAEEDLQLVTVETLTGSLMWAKTRLAARGDGQELR